MFDRYRAMASHNPIISYAVDQPNWRRVIDQRLRERGWRGVDQANPYDSANYYRLHRFWFLTISEMVAVRGTSTHATITVRRQMTIFGKRFP
jgi:hypothetical protein